ncbi:hypothetical protein ATKI12_8486 [Kitasatospora sp. Ki12]
MSHPPSLSASHPPNAHTVGRPPAPGIQAEPERGRKTIERPDRAGLPE